MTRDPEIPARGLAARPEVPVLTFLGGAGTVTGSRFLVDTPDARVLVDAGLFQGLKPLRLRNWERFPVDPAGIDAVVVTHAHVDHVGYLPVLARDGYRGAVHATAGTVDLAGIVLPDSGHLHEEEAAYANRKGFSKHHPVLPLYTEEDARWCLRQFETHPLGDEVEVAAGVHLTLRPAGHILGSATVSLRLDGPRPGGWCSAATSVDPPTRSCSRPHPWARPTSWWSSRRTATGATTTRGPSSASRR